MLIFFCLAVLGPDCFARAVSSCNELGLLPVAVHRLLTRGLLLPQSKDFSSCGPGLSCSVACGIFPDQGLNQCLPPWQANFYPLHHQGILSSLFSLAISSVN